MPMKINAMCIDNQFRLMFGQPLSPESEEHKKLVATTDAVSKCLSKHMAEIRSDMMEATLAKAVAQALLCGDFEMHIMYGPNSAEGQSCDYMPYRRARSLQAQVDASIARLETARYIYNLQASKESKCEHDWKDSPTDDCPTNTACKKCGQTCPF